MPIRPIRHFRGRQVKVAHLPSRCLGARAQKSAADFHVETIEIECNLVDDEYPSVWTGMEFAAAQRNFYETAGNGIHARLYWPGPDRVGADEWVLGTLLPMAYEGLDRWGVAADIRDRLLGVIERRARAGRNGASWQTSTALALANRGLARPAVLSEMLRRYCEHREVPE